MMKRGPSLTQEQIAEAKVLKHTGWSLRRIGERLGCSYEVVRRAIEADYAGQRAIQVREQRELRRFKQNRSDRVIRENASSVSMKEDAAARLAEIPDDTRSLTARFCGDPIPKDPRRQRQSS